MRYDVIVVGAGPAGSVAAYHAAKAGLHTLLVDQAIFPRNKTCAGGLTTAADAFLPEPLPAELCLCTISKLSTWIKDSERLYDRTECFMRTVDRIAFDAWLLHLAIKAGAETHLGDRALRYQPQRDRIAVYTQAGELHGRLVIAADGANSVIACQLRHGIRPPLGYCLQVEVAGNDAVDTIAIHYGSIRQGYGWVFPRQQSRVVGVGGVLGRFREPQLSLDALMRCHQCTTSSPPQGHTIPIGGHWLPVSDDGVLLVGDAAGFVDPFTGEGIRYALWSGLLAAQAASAALSRQEVPSAAHLSVYAERCQQLIMPQLRHAYRLSQAFFRFPNQLQPRLFGRPEPIEKLLDVLQGQSDYPQLDRWLLRHLPRLLLFDRP